MLVALGSSLLYIAWVASIRNADQIGQLAVATLIVGASCAFASLMLALIWLGCLAAQVASTTSVVVAVLSGCGIFFYVRRYGADEPHGS